MGRRQRHFKYFQNIPKYNERHVTELVINIIISKWPQRGHPQTFSSSAPHDTVYVVLTVYGIIESLIPYRYEYIQR